MRVIRSTRVRKAIISTNDNKVVHVEGMSVTDVERVLEKTKDINVIDTGKVEEA